MEADCLEGEPEYTDIFKCNNPDCGNTSVIPSAVIISSQLFSAVAGTLLSLYLLIINLTNLILAKSPAPSNFIIHHSFLTLLALIYITCFGLLFYKAIQGIRLKRHFKKSIR
jgi:hypothetical protein